MLMLQPNSHGYNGNLQGITFVRTTLGAAKVFCIGNAHAGILNVGRNAREALVVGFGLEHARADFDLL